MGLFSFTDLSTHVYRKFVEKLEKNSSTWISKFRRSKRILTELQKKITCLEPKRWTRRWYLLVIVLLYIGLLASFSLNVSLLLRKPAASVSRSVTSEDSDPSSSATAASVTGDETGGEISNNQGRIFLFYF